MQVKINGNDTRYVLSMEGTGPWLTFIHPLGADLAVWDQLAGYFASRYQVLRFDLRGHGPLAPEMDPVPFSVEELADDLAALLDAVGAARSHVVGLSLGGMVAQAFALDYPERLDRLVLCDTSPGTPEAAQATFLERAESARQGGMESLVEPTLARWLTPKFRESHPEVVEPIREILSDAHPAGYAAACEAIAGFDLRDRLTEITAPTLVVAGEEDAGMPKEIVEQFTQGIPHSQSLMLPGAHLAVVEHPGLFARALDAFLTGASAKQE